MQDEYRLSTLDNGLRVVSEPMGGINTAITGTWVKIGSRYESPELNGVTHFLEHFLFKGTSRRNQLQLVDAVEFPGGGINASTNQEITNYFTWMLRQDVAAGFNVVAEIICDPSFPESELAKEHGVVIEEIKRSIDDAGDHLQTKFLAQCFAGQPLGRPILGTPETVSSFTRQILLDYVRGSYTPERMVVAGAGDVSHQQLVDLSGAAYGHLKPAANLLQVRPAVYTGGDVRVVRDMQQNQIYLGFEGFERTHANWPATAVITRALGGGMSTPLYQEIRQERGLVYTIGVSNFVFADAGTMFVSAGLSPANMPEYLDTVSDVLHTAVDRLTERDLEKVKNGIRANIKFSLDGPFNRADRLANDLLQRNEVSDVEELVQRVATVTLDEVKRVRAQILGSKLTVAAIGDLRTLEDYDKIADRFKSFRADAVIPG